MFHVQLTYLNILIKGVFLPTVFSVALKWRRIDKNILDEMVMILGERL